MNEISFLLIFSLWYGLALVVEKKYGKNSSLGEEWTFFLSCLLTPPIMFALFRFFPAQLLRKGK